MHHFVWPCSYHKKHSVWVLVMYVAHIAYYFYYFSGSHPYTMSDSIITIQVDKDYGRNRGTSFKRFQNERKFWDCKVVGTKTLYCHSILICALSPVLEELIETKIREGLEKVVTFEDVQPEVMQKIMNYMYTGSVNIPKELVFEVVQVRDELKI